jgi:hypothetical protein
MPGIMWYFVIALVILLGVMLAVPSEGAQAFATPPQAIVLHKG